ncbi:MAG: hypothetical protein KC561_03785, partial [Myxococcales bacterium]|nr:hypothetical protein [Myxococcales bacterium]
ANEDMEESGSQGSSLGPHMVVALVQNDRDLGSSRVVDGCSVFTRISTGSYRLQLRHRRTAVAELDLLLEDSE